MNPCGCFPQGNPADCPAPGCRQKPAPSVAVFRCVDDRAPGVVEGPNGFSVMCYAAEMVADELNRLWAARSMGVSSWIPVSERLPAESMGTVLVARWERDEERPGEIKHIVEEVNILWLRTYPFGVTHWMPMPSHPESATKQQTAEPNAGPWARGTWDNDALGKMAQAALQSCPKLGYMENAYKVVRAVCRAQDELLATPQQTAKEGK